MEEAKKAGVYSVLHTDGNATALLPDIIKTGIHAIQAIDPVAGMNIKDIKDKVNGQICIGGNMDCGLLITGTPEEIYSSAADMISYCKKDGNFVLGASNAVVMETPMENYRAMIKAWKDFGQY